VISEYLPAGAPDIWGAYTAGEITHFEAMRRYMAYAPTDAARMRS
jgi:hypothetical protein